VLPSAPSIPDAPDSEQPAIDLRKLEPAQPEDSGSN
jgi:hypothetical protein